MLRGPLLGLMLALAGCKDHGGAAPAPTASALEHDAAVSARRPTHRYYLTRTEARCEVTFVDQGVVSPPTSKPCPPDLEVGERIRIAGMTCVRESADTTRVEPVVCPDALTNREKADLRARDAGAPR